MEREAREGLLLFSGEMLPRIWERRKRKAEGARGQQGRSVVGSRRVWLSARGS